MSRNTIAIILASLSTVFVVILFTSLWIYFHVQAEKYCIGHPEHDGMYECQNLYGNDN